MPDDKPLRRVSMTVTGYLRHGHPVAGWYDMTTQADGDGQDWSIPEFAVDEATVADVPAEALSDDDWDEIRGHVASRFGDERAEGILAKFRRTVDAASTPWQTFDGQPPGTTLIARLKQLGMRQTELSRATGLSTKHVNQVVKGVIGVSAEVALLLECETGIPAAVWNRLDAAWREQKARARAEGAGR